MLGAAWIWLRSAQVPCPYGTGVVGLSRWMGSAKPRMYAGHGVPCPRGERMRAGKLFDGGGERLGGGGHGLRWRFPLGQEDARQDECGAGEDAYAKVFAAESE